jgi:hypothetical protein
MILQLALIAQLMTPIPAQECAAKANAPTLDHAIIVVRDLDAAASAFKKHGFRIKPGRLHANGLLNRHIKFRDGTEIELMTVQGTPGDSMAKRYADLLAGGARGVYVALQMGSLQGAQHKATALGMQTRLTRSGMWQFLSFPAPLAAAALFLTAGAASVQDADSIFQHRPAVGALSEVWVEGDARLGELLHELGAAPCGRARGPDGKVGQRWRLGRGSIVIVPMRGDTRPVVLGAVLESAGAGQRLLRPLPNFWLQYHNVRKER